MAIPRTTARKLCTDLEFSLVDASFQPQINELKPADLNRRIKRARAARDKYRMLSERGIREGDGSSQPRGRSPAQNDRDTMLKQQIFDETMVRYEKRLAAFDPMAPPMKTGPRQGPSSAGTGARPAVRRS